MLGQRPPVTSPQCPQNVQVCHFLFKVPDFSQAPETSPSLLTLLVSSRFRFSTCEEVEEASLPLTLRSLGRRKETFRLSLTWGTREEQRLLSLSLTECKSRAWGH